MPYTEIKYNLKATTRSGIRNEITKLFIAEEAGTGKGDLSSRYCYMVESYNNYTIELHRPAGLNKGYDFTVHINGLFFKKARKRTYPSHDDIFECLNYVRENYSFQDYNKVRKLIIDIFNYKSVNINEVRDIYFKDYMGKDRPIAIILLSIKWLFIEQDITYWNWSGRKMLMEGLEEKGLV